MTALLDRRISENNLPRRQPKCLDNAANVARVSRATNRFLKRRDTSTVGKKVFFSPQRDRFGGGKKKYGEKPVRFPEIFTQEVKPLMRIPPPCFFLLLLPLLLWTIFDIRSQLN